MRRGASWLISMRSCVCMRWLMAAHHRSCINTAHHRCLSQTSTSVSVWFGFGDRPGRGPRFLPQHMDKNEKVKKTQMRKRKRRRAAAIYRFWALVQGGPLPDDYTPRFTCEPWRGNFGLFSSLPKGLRGSALALPDDYIPRFVNHAECSVHRRSAALPAAREATRRADEERNRGNENHEGDLSSSKTSLQTCPEKVSHEVRVPAVGL